MIEARNLRLRRGGRDILDGYSFALGRGEVLAVLGANGIGKTTLLDMLIGILPPSGGDLTVTGRAGFVPQLFEAPFSYSVLDIALMGRARHLGLFGSPGQRDYVVTRAALARLGIADLADRPFNALSGGQRQLAVIAQALASECDLLVLDEPCSALDYRNQDVVLGLLAGLRAEQGMTIVFTTHAPQHALQIASHVMLMAGPRDYRAGPVDEVLTAGNLSGLYGLPIGRARFEGGDRHTFAPLFGTGKDGHDL